MSILKNFTEGSFKTIGTGILGEVALNAMPMATEALPTVQEVQTGLGIISQLVVLVATLIALFKRKKKQENE